MPVFPFPLQSNPQEFRENGDERLINCFAERIDVSGQDVGRFRIRSLPGYTVFSDDVNDVNCRGAIEADGNLYTVWEGGNVVRIDSVGTRTAIGYIGGTGPVDMARNGATPFQIGCVAIDTGRYYVIEANVVTLVDTRDLPAFNSICWVAGYFVLGVNDGRFFNTGLNAARSINGLDYATAEGNPDGLRRVFANRLELVLAGEISTEFWGVDPNAPATGSPFIRLGGAVIDKGCAGPLAMARIDNAFMWVGSDGKVYRFQNYSALRVSHYGVERSVAAQQDKTTIRANRWQYKGNEFFQISGDDFTWLYNAATGFWSEGASYLRGRLNAEIYAEAWGGTYATTKINGTVYRMDDANFMEGTETLANVIRFADAPRNTVFNSFEAVFVSGRATQTGTINQIAPQLELRWSDDGGAKYGAPRVFQGGAIGEYVKRIRALRLGKSGLKWGRRYEIRNADPHVTVLSEVRVNEAAT